MISYISAPFNGYASLCKKFGAAVAAPSSEIIIKL